MEKFYLEKVNIKRKKEAIEFINEHIEHNSNINGTGGLDRAVINNEKYENWLEEALKLENKEYANKLEKVPASTYFFIRENDNKIIGMINIRHYLNDFLRKHGGHIGYGIRPAERRKGYSKIQLYLALIESRNIGIDKVMLDCVSTNIGSEKTMKSLGGVFEKEYYDKDIVLHKYWINVEESIEKYKDLYINKISKN